MKSGASSDVSGAIFGPFYVRDAEGKVIHQETLIGDRSYTVDYTYDSKGRVSFLRDSLNQEWQYEYTPSGKIRKVTRPDKNRIFYNYDREDQLVKIDLPWGYKVCYEKKGDQYIKTVKKFPNLTIYQFVYTLDNKGNKVKVEEGSQKQKGFEYRYDGNNRLKEIWDLKTGEKNSDVLEFKGKIKNGSTRGALEAKNGKYQDKQYEYVFDGRGNIIRQKEKRGGMEVQRIYNGRNLLVREKYLSQSANALTVLYDYDANDSLIMKTVDDRVRYQYFRDQDGHLLHKITRNLRTGEEIDGFVYTPFHSDIDQDGFEMIKDKNTEKLFIRDAEGNVRYKVDITDVMKRKITLLERKADTDGDYWGGAESLLGLVADKLKNPGKKTGTYAHDFYDLPLNDPNISGERVPFVQNFPAEASNSKSNYRASLRMSIGCYGYQMNAFPSNNQAQMMEEGCAWWLFDFCVNCWDGYMGEDLGGGYDCQASIWGPGQLDYNQEGNFYLNTNCNDPQDINWIAWSGYGWGNGSSYSCSWDESSIDRNVDLGATFSTSSGYDFTDSIGYPVYYYDVVGKEAWTYVYISDPNPPHEPAYSIEISGWDSSGGGHSFTTNDTITVYGRALCDGADISNQIAWSVSGEGSGSGAQYSFQPNSSGRPLSCSITAILSGTFSIISSISSHEASITIVQDKLDELRQEYIDCSAWTPARDFFDRNSPYHSGLLGEAADSGKHDYWHILTELNSFASGANAQFNSICGGAINFTSGYRCPEGNYREEGTYSSQHLFGRAFDFVQIGGSNLDYYRVWLAAISAGASGAYLHGTNGGEYWNPTYPSDLSYDRGHAQLW